MPPLEPLHKRARQWPETGGVPTLNVTMAISLNELGEKGKDVNAHQSMRNGPSYSGPIKGIQTSISEWRLLLVHVIGEYCACLAV